MNNYIDLQEQKEFLLQQNTKYFNDLTDANNKIANLQSETNGIPVFNFSNLALSIDGDDIPVNKSNSMVTIDGIDYFSREITESLIPDNQNFTIKDDTLFIGRVIAEKEKLTEQWIVDSDLCDIENSMKDSYGNTHTDVLSFYASNGSIIFNLDSEYSYCKFTIAPSESRRIDGSVNITIKADDEVVFSDDIDKKTKATTNEIPINDCSTLTIQYEDSMRNPYYHSNCIISDAIVYN